MRLYGRWMRFMDSGHAFTMKRATQPYDWAAILRLIHTEYAYMEGRIDPPSSMLQLTPDSIAQQAADGEIWVIENIQGRPVACMFLSPQPPELYLGKIAVSHGHQGQGLARKLVAQAEARAAALGLSILTLQTRVELTDNHAAFAALGFAITGETAHQGYNHPTSITMQRSIGG